LLQIERPTISAARRASRPPSPRAPGFLPPGGGLPLTTQKTLAAGLAHPPRTGANLCSSLIIQKVVKSVKRGI
jgi:hypothetical protein